MKFIEKKIRINVYFLLHEFWILSGMHLANLKQ